MLIGIYINKVNNCTLTDKRFLNIKPPFIFVNFMYFKMFQNYTRVYQNIRKQCINVGSFIFSSNKNNSVFTALLSHYFSTLSPALTRHVTCDKIYYSLLTEDRALCFQPT